MPALKKVSREVQHYTNKVSKRLGSNIEYMRAVYNLSQRELSLAARVDHSYIADIEGATRRVTVEVLARIAYAFHATPGMLLDADLKQEAKKGLEEQFKLYDSGAKPLKKT